MLVGERNLLHLTLIGLMTEYCNMVQLNDAVVGIQTDA